MATRVYLPSSGAAPVTPSTWNFANQINPLTFAGSLTKTSSTMTTKTEATGTTSPTARAMLRYVIGPLEAQTIAGTVSGQIRGVESNAGANASPALAVKIIQPGGADRATLLAQTAGDSAAVGVEFVSGATLTNARFLSSTEVNPTLTSQSAQRGDYLVIEIGFRSATTTSRNISLRYGDTGGTDLTAGNTAETTDLVPWIEFSQTLRFYTETPAGELTLTGAEPTLVTNFIMALGIGALSLAGLAPTLEVSAPVEIQVPAGSLTLAGTDVEVAFTGPETGSLTFTGQAPSLVVGADITIPVPAGALTFTGRAPNLLQSLIYGLVGLWPMDETGATDPAIDVHGNHDLTMRDDGGGNSGQNPIDSTPARDLEFDSTNAFYGAADALAWSNDQAWTLIFRFSTESLNGRNYIELAGVSSPGTGANDYDMIVSWFNGVGIGITNWDVSDFQDDVYSGPTSLALSTTYWVACGHDPVANKIWIKVNAAARAELAWTTGTRFLSGSQLVLGDAMSDFFDTSHDGAFGPAALWDRVLTDPEVDAFIAAGGDYEAIGGVVGTVINVPVGNLSLSGRVAEPLHIFYGVEPIPTDRDLNSAYSDAESRHAMERAIAGGAEIISVSKGWNELETSEGVYALGDVSRIFEEANDGGVGVCFTLVILSYDGTRKTPAYLSGDALDSTNVKTALSDLVDAIHALTGSHRLKILLLGNEVEVYLSTHSSDITPFANLIANEVTHARGLSNWSTLHVTASFKWTDAAAFMTTYDDIEAAVTIPAFTYYPINGDLTVMYTNAGAMSTEVFNDLLALYTDIGAQKFLISETGYPSSTVLNGSEVLQASFTAAMLGVPGIFGPGVIYSVQLQWLTDWPTWLLDLLGVTGNAREFIGTLGLRDSENWPKASWSFFRDALGGVDIAVDYNVHPAVGALTLTGLTPSLGAGVGVPVGGLALSGLAPSLPMNIGRATDAGALTLSGLTPSAVIEVTINVPSGALTLEGQTPSLNGQSGVTPGAGALVLAGLAPNPQIFFVAATPNATLALEGQPPIMARSVTTPAGALTLAGLAPSLSQGIGRATDAGALTLTGLAPASIANIIRVTDTGALVLAGLAPNVLTAFTVSVPAGALTLSGQTVALNGQSNIATDAGVLTLSGLAPGLKTDVLTSTGALTLAGAAPVASVGFPRATPAGALTLAGLAPSVPLSIAAATPAGALTLTGLTPNVVFHFVLATQPGALTLTGETPNVRLTALAATQTGTLTLTGFAPVVGGTVTVHPAAGALALTGLAPASIPNVYRSTGAGALSLNGLTPTLAFATYRVTDVGALVLQGHAPGLASTDLIPAGALTLDGLEPSVVVGFIRATGNGTLTLTGTTNTFAYTVQVPAGTLTLTGQLPDVIGISPDVANASVRLLEPRRTTRRLSARRTTKVLAPRRTILEL
jgi:hypothetical protein